jgi:hypothetical protein
VNCSISLIPHAVCDQLDTPHWPLPNGHIPPTPLLQAAAPRQDQEAAEKKAQRLRSLAKQGDADAITRLLDASEPPPINARESVDGTTALIWAVRRGHAGVVEVLLARDADPNVTDEDGKAPLHFAAERGRRGLVEPLLARGARVQATTLGGQTARDLVRGEHREEILELLQVGGPPEGGWVDQMTWCSIYTYVGIWSVGSTGRRSLSCCRWVGPEGWVGRSNDLVSHIEACLRRTIGVWNQPEGRGPYDRWLLRAWGGLGLA